MISLCSLLKISRIIKKKIYYIETRKIILYHWKEFSEFFKREWTRMVLAIFIGWSQIYINCCIFIILYSLIF